MSLKPEQALISVGFDKYGQAEFAINMGICDLSFERMKELRAMIPVAIGVMEDIWRREREKDQLAMGAEEQRIESRKP